MDSLYSVFQYCNPTITIASIHFAICMYVSMSLLISVILTHFLPTVIPEIIFPNDSSPGYIVNVTDPVTFVCTATGIPPPTIRWFRDGVLLSSRVVLSEPSQTTVPAPMGTGMIYQVERTLTFVTTDSDADTYTCEASNMNVVQSATAQNFTLFVQGNTHQNMNSPLKQRLYIQHAFLCILSKMFFIFFSLIFSPPSLFPSLPSSLPFSLYFTSPSPLSSPHCDFSCS